MGIPPDVVLTFRKEKQISSEAIQELIEQHKDKEILTLILKALLTANTLQSKITFDKFFFAGVSIKLGIPPQVSLKYQHNP